MVRLQQVGTVVDSEKDIEVFGWNKIDRMNKIRMTKKGYLLFDNVQYFTGNSS